MSFFKSVSEYNIILRKTHFYWKENAIFIYLLSKLVEYVGKYILKMITT